MIPTLNPIFRQLEETYDAVRISIELAGESQLGWKPALNANTFAEVAEHIASANLTYATVIGPTNVQRKWEFELAPTTSWVLARLDESLATAKSTIEGVTDDNLHESRSDDWCPNCDEQLIQGPLDALWFVQQMVRHTAYHLGQLNLYLRLMGIGSYD